MNALKKTKTKEKMTVAAVILVMKFASSNAYCKKITTKKISTVVKKATTNAGTTALKKKKEMLEPRYISD